MNKALHAAALVGALLAGAAPETAPTRRQRRPRKTTPSGRRRPRKRAEREAPREIVAARLAAAVAKRARRAKGRLVSVSRQRMGDRRAAERFGCTRTFYVASSQHPVTPSTISIWKRG